MDMNKVEYYKGYFNKFSEEWIAGAYSQSDYNYPVGYHRLRVLLKAISNENLNGKKVLDIGCGGGDISFSLAERGADVIGIDMSDSMLDTANGRKKKMPEDIKNKIQFYKENILELSEGIKKQKFDYIIAFGLIGYLESDAQFFEIITQLSKQNTVLFLSCRNELFNITSVSDNTIREINTGNALDLIDEINMYYEKEISCEKSRMFLNELSRSLNHLDGLNFTGCYEENKDIQNDNLKDTKQITLARQSTPESLRKTAMEYNFDFCKYWGIHPHLLLPKFNKKLPPKVFNILSDALCVFEDDDISLIWSSVFIGKFEKRN